MQKFIDLCITSTPTFDWDRRVPGRVLHCLVEIAST